MFVQGGFEQKGPRFSPGRLCCRFDFPVTFNSERRMDSLKDLNERHRRFVEERNWQRHQSPKNLVMALSGEVGELSELFQWLTVEESWKVAGEDKRRVAEELADVLIYLTRIADELGIDLVAAAHEKCDGNDRKYPKDQFQDDYRRPHEYKER